MKTYSTIGDKAGKLYLSDKQIQQLISEIKSKKIKVDSNLNQLINQKFKKIESKSKKYLNQKKGSDFIGNLYKGELDKEGFPHGVGNILYQIEDMYNGQFFFTLRHGIGKYTYFGSSDKKYHPFNIPYYIGEWFADAYSGLGKKLITDFEDLMIYEGNFHNNKMSGFATYKKLEKANDKIPQTELIGHFLDGQGYKHIIEIHRDKKGKISIDQPSGLLEYNLDQKAKTLIYQFKDISEWDNVKIIKNCDAPSKYPLLYHLQEKEFYDKEHYSKKFIEVYMVVRILLTKLQQRSAPYYINNSNNKTLMKFYDNINKLNRSFYEVNTIKQCADYGKELDNLKKEFEKLEKTLKK
jgi:hypothetical protein